MMSNVREREEYIKLCKEIIRYNNEYYVDNRPSISDMDYDNLLLRLEELEDKYPTWITDKSPTQDLQLDIDTSRGLVRHPTSMLGMDSVYTIDDYMEWSEAVIRFLRPTLRFTYQHKLDGVSTNLVYVNKYLVQGLTRGTGCVGESIMDNLMVVSGVQRTIDQAGNVEIRGDVVFVNSFFREVNDYRRMEGKHPYSNAGEAAADIIVTEGSPYLKYLKFIAHGVVTDNYNFPNEISSMDFVEKLGFEVVESFRSESMVGEYNRLHRNAVRSELKYPLEGLVAKVNDRYGQIILSNDGSINRWCVALKFPPSTCKSFITEIQHVVSEDGTVSPRATLEGVKCGGLTITTVDLENYSEMVEMNAHVKGVMSIEKENDSAATCINVEGTIEGEYDVPSVCPVCKSTLRTDGMVRVYCPNLSGCTPQLTNLILHFVSQDAADISGLDLDIIERLIKSNRVSSIPDIYSLNIDDLTLVCGDIKAGWILKSIEQSKVRPAANLVYGLGWYMMTLTVSRRLMELVDIDGLMKIDDNTLRSVTGLGPFGRDIIIQSTKDGQKINDVKKLIKCGVKFAQYEADVGSKPLRATYISITGDVQGDEWIYTKRLECLGATVQEITSDTDILVNCGGMETSQYKKAIHLKVRIINEQDLIELLDKYSN